MTESSKGSFDFNKILYITNTLNYREQAIFFLNLSSDGGDQEKCKQVWIMHKKIIELDKKGEDGSSIDEIHALRLLEYCNQACTVHELRNFRSSLFNHTASSSSSFDNKKVSLIELLTLKFGVECLKHGWEAQNEANDYFEKAHLSLKHAIASGQKASNDVDAGKHAEEIAAQEEQTASKAVAACRIEETRLLDEKEQAQKALDELNEKFTNIHRTKSHLEKLVNNEHLGIVKKNKAKAELTILLSKDNLPLESFKIKQETAIQKLDKAMDAAMKATLIAELAVKEAQSANTSARHSKEEALCVEKNAGDLVLSAKQTVENFHEVLKRDENGFGTMFYKNREFEETNKFLPKKRIRIAR